MKLRVFIYIGLLLTWLPLLLAPRAYGQAAHPSSDQFKYIDVGGLRRSYLLHLPQGYDGKAALPVVLVFHGGAGNAGNAARMTGMSPKADREKFIAVYPNGTGRLANALLTWNTWRCCGRALNNNVDDVGFVKALVVQLESQYKIDPKRIYATGLSNGGMMSYRVGCELSDIFAAIAPVAGALDTDTCNATRPVSAIIFHGTADKHILYEGGVPIRRADFAHKRVDNSVAYAVNYWVKRDQCNPQPVRTRSGSIIHDVYSGGLSGTAVELYTIEGQGHAWPGGRPGLRNGNADQPTQEISATDLMWEFFKRHPKQ